jgi:hypothetical protein
MLKKRIVNGLIVADREGRKKQILLLNMHSFAKNLV